MASVIGSAAAADTYTVYDGDTLSQIAERYGMTVRELTYLNGIDDPDLIFPGQQIVLSGGGSGVAEEAAVEYSSDDADTTEWYDEGVSQGGSFELPPYFPQWQVRDLLIDAANRYGWDPNLIMAQAWQESYWRQDEISWTGAIGVMQVMPSTAAEMESWYFGYDMNTFYSAYDNIEMGVAYLSVLYEETGSVELALASYYQGWGSVQRDGFFPDTHEYVDRIFMFQQMFANGELP
ncbi:MAG: LysM peptidoglycan-binding domain-containing protein [Thermomicrobiales bacterium]|nr:LysM peptidoglycan-binding domain-containing protein [Thermomicrobiales bacterium]